MTPVVYVMRNDQPVDTATFQYLMRFVPEEKRERILRQRVKKNADNMLVGAVLTKYMLLKYFQIPFSKQHISYGRYGKPYLRDYSNAYFNISHSGQFVACAVSDCPIGVDIQEIASYHRDVARRVFSPEELSQIESSPDRSAEFTRLWTQKEAYLKMLGTGFSERLDKITLFKQSKVQTTRYMNILFLSVYNCVTEGCNSIIKIHRIKGQILTEKRRIGENSIRQP